MRTCAFYKKGSLDQRNIKRHFLTQYPFLNQASLQDAATKLAKPKFLYSPSRSEFISGNGF